MDFIVIAKDWKQEWKELDNTIKKAEKMGLKYIQEHRGDEFGVDSDFFVLGNEEELYKYSGRFIQAGVFESQTQEEDYDTKSEFKGRIIKECTEDEEGNLTIVLKRGGAHRMLVTPI